MSSSESDSGEEAPALYKFTLVQFVHKGKKRRLEQIDIVPRKWLKFDNSRGRCTTQYAPINSNTEDYQVLHDLVRMLADAPESYTTFTVDIKGRAETYEEGMQKLEKLKHVDHVLSLESEQSASEVQKSLEKAVKQQSLQREAEKLKELMKSKKADSEDDDQPTAPKKRKKGGKNKSPTISTRPTSHGSENNVSHQDTIVHPRPTPTNNSFSNRSDSPLENSGYVNSHALQNQVTIASSAVKEPLKVGVASTSNASVDEEEPESNVVATLELPVLDWQNVKCSTPFESAALAELTRLSKMVENMQIQQNSMCNFLLDKRVVNVINHKVDFSLKYNYEVPFSSKERFNQFNEDLKQNQYLKNDTCYELTLLVDKDYVLTKSYVAMLKRFLTKDLAMQYTAMRASKTDKSKETFRGNEFSKCMDVVIYGMRTEKGLTTDDKDLISALSDVLCNSKKWT